MPVELLYLVVALFFAVVIAALTVRRLRRRGLLQPPDWPDDEHGDIDRSSWLLRFQAWLFSPPNKTPVGLLKLEQKDELTAVAPAPNTSASLNQIRFPAAAALLGGGLLLAAGLAIKNELPSAERPWYWGVMLAGFLAFGLAGQLVTQQQLPAWISCLSLRLARYLDVSAGQLTLLVLAPCFALLAFLAAGDKLQARHGLIATLAWLAAAGLVIAGSYHWGKEARLRIGWKEWAFTAVIFIIAFLLRGTNLAGIPTTLSGDEAASGLVALDFRNGQANNLFTFGWYAFPSLYFPIQGLGIRFLGQTTEALRITSAVGGALAVAAGYWLARALFDRTMGVFTAVYLTASHYHIHMSRIGLNNIWDSLFSALAIMGLWHGWKTGRRSSFVLAGVALGFGQYFYVSMRTLPVIFLVWAGVAFWRERDRFWRRLSGFMTAAYIAFILVLPFAAQSLRSLDNFWAPYTRVSVFSQDWLAREMSQSGQTAVEIITGQMLTTALGFTHQPLRLLYNPGAPLLLGATATLFLAGIFWVLTHFDLKFLLITMPMALVVITGGFSHSPPASQRFILVTSLAAMIVVLPLRLAVDWLQQLWPQAKPILLLGAGLIMAGIVWGDLHYYFYETVDDYVLGGFNTETATEIAYYLRDHEMPAQRVYFFGFPRMGYFSLATISYLAPQMEGVDIDEPLRAPPDWELDGPTLFIFLPERLAELEQVRVSYPDGRYRAFTNGKGQELFSVYELIPDG